MKFDFDEFKRGNNILSWVGLAIIVLAFLLFPSFTIYGNNALLAFPIPIYIGGILWKVTFYKKSSHEYINYRKYTNIYLVLSGLSLYPVLNVIFNIGIDQFLSTSGSTSVFINDTQAQILKLVVIALILVDTYVMYYLLYQKPKREMVISKTKLKKLNKFLTSIENGTKLSFDQIGTEIGLTSSVVKEYLIAILGIDQSVGEIVDNNTAFIKLTSIGNAVDKLLATVETPKQETKT